MLKKYPFYIKCTVILFGLILFIYVLFYLRGILVPFAFGLMLAILLNPFVNSLQNIGIPRILAISVSVLTAILIFAITGYVLSKQIASFSTELPLLKKKIIYIIQRIQMEVAQRFNYGMSSQNEFINQAKVGTQPFMGQTLMTIIGGIEAVLLIPMYSFLFLYYKKLIINFLYEVFAEENSKEVSAVLTQTKGAIQSYMFGLLLEAVIVACLNSIALMILGIEYGILLGILGAIINVLPFIGGIVSILLPIAIATLTKDGISTQIGIILSYIFIQFVDNHFLIPYIVSSRVKINALCSIVIVLMGGSIWGISGMFLSIPFIGVLKIIFDKIPQLKAWGKLLGDHVPTRYIGQIRAVRRRSVAK